MKKISIKNKKEFTLAESARRTGYNATNIGGFTPIFASLHSTENPLPLKAKERGYVQDDMTCVSEEHLVSNPSPLEGEGVRRTGEGESARRTGHNATNIGGMLPAFAKAFTLAEVLITLGIIGIVAAMTLPVLMNKISERQTVTQLQETYSILSQAIRLSEEQYGGLSTWTTESSTTAKGAQDIADKLKPSLKILHDCGLRDTNNNCVADKYYQRNGSFHANYHTDSRYYKIVLLNGSTVWWKTTDFASERTGNGGLVHFYVDTNGTKLPNKWGNDLFYFMYNENEDALIPGGTPNTFSPYETHCKPLSSTGWGCAWWVLKNKNLNYK